MKIDEKGTSNQVDQALLNTLGALGWEVCGVGVFGALFSVILKRELLPLPSPVDVQPSWQADPTGRFARRYWDGVRWSEHVADANDNTSKDLPVR